MKYDFKVGDEADRTDGAVLESTAWETRKIEDVMDDIKTTIEILKMLKI